MSKRMKVLVSVLVAVVLLTVGGATMVMAQEEPEPTPPPEVGKKGLLVRVAGILNIPQENLVNAFKQAQQEMREGAFIRHLDKAVEKGRITEEEAGQIEAWWVDRPEVLDQGLLQRAFGVPALGSRHMWGARTSPAIRGHHMRGGYRGWCPDNTT